MQILVFLFKASCFDIVLQNAMTCRHLTGWSVQIHFGITVYSKTVSGNVTLHMTETQLNAIHLAITNTVLMEITSVQATELQTVYNTENQWFSNLQANYHVWSNLELPANHDNIPSIFNTKITTSSTNTQWHTVVWLKWIFLSVRLFMLLKRLLVSWLAFCRSNIKITK